MEAKDWIDFKETQPPKDKLLLFAFSELDGSGYWYDIASFTQRYDFHAAERTGEYKVLVDDNEGWTELDYTEEAIAYMEIPDYKSNEK